MFRHSTENKAPCHFPSFFSESNTKSNAKHYIVTSSTTCTIGQSLGFKIKYVFKIEDGGQGRKWPCQTLLGRVFCKTEIH